MSSSFITLVEKAALDSGFDRSHGWSDGWFRAASTQIPQCFWISVAPDETLRLAHAATVPMFALQKVQLEVMPQEAVVAYQVDNLALLQDTLRQFFREVRRQQQTLQHLQQQLSQEFRTRTEHLPATTEAERWVVQRIGQDLFREKLLHFWGGRCALTGLAVPELLRASHIKPWRDCCDEERLDVYNGLLLAAHLDAAFDKHLISFAEDGILLVSDKLDQTARTILGLHAPLQLQGLHPKHLAYLSTHRATFYLNA